MSVHITARTLGISETELFVRAHRALGSNDRAELERDFRRYDDAGQIPEYVSAFLASLKGELSHEKTAFHVPHQMVGVAA